MKSEERVNLREKKIIVFNDKKIRSGIQYRKTERQFLTRGFGGNLI